MQGNSENCPAKKLKDKYIPIEEVYSVCGITIEDTMKLIEQRKIRSAEFAKPGAYKRTLHVNPEEILMVLFEEECKKCEKSS